MHIEITMVSQILEIARGSDIKKTKIMSKAFEPSPIKSVLEGSN
jgi:hypothetical protein